MDATQATAEPTDSKGMDAQAPRSLENDGTNNQGGGSNQGGDSPDGNADIAKLDSPEALAAFMANLSTSTTPGDRETEHPEGSETQDGAQNATGTEPEGDAETASQPEGAEQTQQQKQPTQPAKAKSDDETEEDDAPLDLAKLPTRYRLQVREDDEVGRLAAALKKRNKDWSLEDALQAAKQRLGKTAAAPAPAADKSTAPKAEAEKPAEKTPSPADEVAGIEAKLKELRAAKRKANEEVDLARVGEIDAEMDELRDRLLEAKVSAKTATAKPAPAPPATPEDAAARTAYDAKFDASLSKANQLYPDAAKADTAFAKRMAEIDRMLEKEGDPLFHSADKPFRVAAMVAAELGVAPQKVTSSPKPAAPATKPGPRTLAPIASGDSRTSTTRTQSAPTVAAIQGLKTPEDLDAFLSKVGGARF